MHFRCKICGGIYDYERAIQFNPEKLQLKSPGIWRYKHTFGLPSNAPEIYLGEGNTPLVWEDISGHEVCLKLEFTNPTGSFKDRGSAVLISFLKSRNINRAIEDSSGNAGASFAAYAANSQISAKIFTPETTSRQKLRQINAYGAELVLVPGPRSASSEAVLTSAAKGETYASHAYMPFGIMGFATIAYEIVDQMKEAPGAIVTPVGQGSLFLGLCRGFEALRAAGEIAEIPVMVGVQSLACAPLWALSNYGAAGLGMVTESDTLAEGVRIKYPIRGDAILNWIKTNQGFFVAVDEQAIVDGVKNLARYGYFVEPTSAIVWDAIRQVVGNVPEPIVAVLTGSGLKSL